MFLSLCIAVLLSFARLNLARGPQSLSPSLKASGAVSNPLSPSFAGFGIESTNLFSFAGHEEKNAFSIQLLQNLADFAGAPPHIRLGGNTQDYMIYDANYTDYYWKFNDNSTAQGAFPADWITYGPSFFTAVDRLPTGTPITYGLNLAYSNEDYLEQIVDAARAAVEGMKNVQLYSFEIGNEADLYAENQMRSGPWGGYEYTAQFLERAKAVYEQVLKPSGFPSNFFEPPATASTIGNTFEIGYLVNFGLTDEVDGKKYVSAWNQHDYFYFAGITPRRLALDDLMELDGTNSQFGYWEGQVGVALKTGIPYCLREMSSYGPIGMHLISDTFGAALWTLNFFLFAATLDISSVQMHMTDNSHASAWQPISVEGKDQFIRPQYYAHVAMAQILGNGNGTTQIANLKTRNLEAAYKGRIRAYSQYTQGDLQAVILINSRQSNASMEDKSSFQFDLDLGKDNSDKDVFLSYLIADGADSLTGTTFNGMLFSDIDGKMDKVDETINTLHTDNQGSVPVSVRDSSAVVVNIGFELGSSPIKIDETYHWEKKSTAGPTGTSGAKTAMWTGAVTTTLALAGTGTGGGGGAEETGTRKGEGSGYCVRWTLLGASLLVIAVGFFWST